MLTSSNILTDLSKHVKTSCSYVNIAKKADNPRRKIFFSLNYNTSRVSEGLNSSLVQAAGEWWPFRKEL